MTIQRIRDPLHDLIQFDTGNELERMLWDVIETRPFQRLRRVKQLGFSDFVYPGASHSRFAHSIGVFHTGRKLMEIVGDHTSVPGSTKEHQALAAALVHDLGHGPFSHSFETVGKRLGLKLASHEAMSDLLIQKGEVADILNGMGSGFARDVADMVAGRGNKSVHCAVVSSQFDADRLDYMRRDRLMTGTQHSAIDFTWLLANLTIAEVPYGVDKDPVGSIETFVIEPKAIHAAEAYVLGLFQLYPTVYLHKATRGAECLFTELLVKVVELVKNGDVKKTGLPKNHPLAKFADSPEDIEVALQLDDTVVSGALSLMADADNSQISDFSRRLRDRKLFKCIDIRREVGGEIDSKSSNDPELVQQIDRVCAEIEEKISGWKSINETDGPRMLVDEGSRSPYKSIDESESKGPLDQINVRVDSGTQTVDLRERSHLVAGLRSFKFFRAYISRDDAVAKSAIKEIIRGELA